MWGRYTVERSFPFYWKCLGDFLNLVQTSHFTCTKLNSYLGQPDSDIELNQLDSIHFHNIQWSTLLTTELNNLWIRFGT